MERIKNIFPKLLIWSTALLLFALPFFWFKSGEMDLGGDSSRLYFYDPVAYLKNYALYSVSPSNFGGENIGYFMIPFVLFLTGVKCIISSPTLLLAGFHGMSFAIAFLACYGIVKELLRKDADEDAGIHSISAFLAGLVYIFSQVSIQGWDKVLVTHNQFFLNPLVFFLLLKYCKTDKKVFLLLFLCISFIFSPNFSFVAAPGFFAFYPVSILFLVIYRLTILKKQFIWKHLLGTFIGLVFLQSFHIIPQMVSMFSAGSVLNATIFSDAGKLDRGLSYFSAIAPNIKVHLNILLLPQMTALSFFSFLFIMLPLVMTIGLLFNKSKTVLLTGIFFLIVLFFASANITHLGLTIYKKLFYLPGFAIFRNFYGQWAYVFLFFYIVLFGQTLATILLKMKKSFRNYVSIAIGVLLLATAIPFLNSSLVNKTIWQSNNMHIFTKLDPAYEKAIAYLRLLPSDEKVLTFPMTDPGYQIISGINDGAYQGPSTISYLAGKKDFAGEVELGLFQQPFLDAVKQGNFIKVQEILTNLGIRYIFYDADPRVYEKGFPSFPYNDVRQYLPKDQKAYAVFLSKLNLKKKKQFGTYALYERVPNQVLPPIFVSRKNIYGEADEATVKEISSIDTNENRLAFFSPKAPIDFYGNSIDTAIFKVDTTTAFNDFLQERTDSIIPTSFISQPLDAFAYPLVVHKEKQYLNTVSVVTDGYIDRAIFYADKRLNELDIFGKEIPLLGGVRTITQLDKTWKEPSFLQEQTYNFWEVSMVRYQRQMTDLVRRMHANSKSAYPQIVTNRYVQKIFSQHKAKLDGIIVNNKPSPTEQQYLLHLSENMFDSLAKQVAVLLPNPTSLEYHFSVPTNDSYTIFIQNADLSYLPHWSLQLQDKNIESNGEQKQSWRKIENVDFKKEADTRARLTVSAYPNVLDGTAWMREDKQASDGAGMSYWVDNTITQNTAGIFRKIGLWEPNATYFLNFDYNTHDKHFFVKIHEQSTAEEHKNTEIFDQQLHSKDWQHFSFVVQSGSEATAGYLHVGKLSNQIVDVLEANLSKESSLDIKNMSLIKIPTPTILVQKDIKEQAITLPQTIFKKVNPTKYEVTVKNITQPFTLLFLNQFNNRWKLFPTDKQQGAIHPATTYYDNQIVELNADTRVFDPNFFETFLKKPIAMQTHVMANGYENAWYIDPKILGSKKEYTFILELTTQQYFYVGAVISVITFILLVVYLVYSFIRYEK